LEGHKDTRVTHRITHIYIFYEQTIEF